jgi:hypothetical protein
MTPASGPATRLLTAPVDRLVRPEDVEAVAGAIEDLIEARRRGELESFARDPRETGVFDSRVTTATLAAVFDRLLTSGASDRPRQSTGGPGR